MRKTKSLRVVVVPDKWLKRPEILQLKEEGHIILSYEDPETWIQTPDLILHEAAHRWDESNWEAKLWPAVKARLRAK